MAGEKWMILLPKKWNKHVQYAWRFDPCELGLPARARPPPRAPMLDDAMTDEEDYMPSDPEVRGRHGHVIDIAHFGRFTCPPLHTSMDPKHIA